MDRADQILYLGIDVGSTTVKAAVVDPKQHTMLYGIYQRHGAKQTETLLQILNILQEKYPHQKFRAAVCGSGGKPIAEKLGVPYIQEVVANAAAVCEKYPQAKTAIELGGQDAKVIFFHIDPQTGKTTTSDMRMNGSCAGGTGAFIDEIASLLRIRTEDMEGLAAQGKMVYEISGRCGVFAKTDIQPLLIQGAKREDIALSAFHAIAKQTIGGLSQGLELKPPIIFEGGPLTFNPTLIRVFAERLNLKDEEILVPEHPETIVAYGTALSRMRTHDGEDAAYTAAELQEHLRNAPKINMAAEAQDPPLFTSEAQKEAFFQRHDKELRDLDTPQIKDDTLSVYIGVDSGSTTSKLVFMDEQERVIDRYYANNYGKPLDVVCKGIRTICEKYQKMGVKVRVLGVGTTGYGENMLAAALGADYHIVETVAHAQACLQYVPNATFLLDIGGQDMKAIWMQQGIITNMTLNEACSSGCGSFLENFADSLQIPVDQIADAAFRSKSPAHLGSRCTVFMNSTIINEQRNGKTPDDIMAGLCRSIIENVFTKVVRVSNFKELGDTIVVQGGTFRNRAVLRAIEEYLGKDVICAPYPGEMGAIGAALLTKRYLAEHGYANGTSSSFIGLDAVKNFTYETQTGVACTSCANHCSRTITRFPNGAYFVTGNRCEKGAVLSEVKQTLSKPKTSETDLDLFAYREKALFAAYPYQQVSADKHCTVGLPRILEFWDSMPFWSTFFKALGYNVKFSHKSNRTMYEQGLSYVASDTICFPAKLAHGHIQDLAEQGVDRIFFPYIMHMPPEGKDKLSPYVCSVVQGYPMVIRNSQNPEERYGIPYDTPIFHWFSEKNRFNQICDYATQSLSVTRKEAENAYAQAEKALLSFRKDLRTRAERLIQQAKENHTFAVVLAGRPYHTDAFISHNISKVFAKAGIAVLPVDSLPGLEEVDLSNTRAEITNNFHTRMLEGAMVAAQTPELEYVQLVSFGCGHDAILTDEITRILDSVGHKSPLILKIDESDATGSIGIRIQSFLETVQIRRKKMDQAQGYRPIASELPMPSPAKFYKKDKKVRTLIIPNISEEVSILLAALLKKTGFIPKTVPIGGRREVQLGKQYVHNDICFPAQMVIGELIGELQRGNYNQDEVAVGMVKFQCDCRMSHYAGLLRKGLDSAGFKDVPIVTTDFNDTKEMHPGVYILNISTVLEAVWVFMMLDMITEVVRKIRPYELNPGETNRVYRNCVNQLADAIQDGIPAAKKAFAQCMDDLNEIPYDRSHLKPRAFVTGELLVTYHPGSNFHIEEYLEKNGMEAVFPRVTDQLRKDFLASKAEIRDYHANIFPYPYVVDTLFDSVQKSLEKIAVRNPLYEKSLRPADMYQGVKDIIPETLSCGEGWLMTAEIAHYAEEGVRSFIILQPFGCLPNHICGRGTMKKLKERYPNIQILPLDFDPDSSFANVENRLQMLIMNDDAAQQTETETTQNEDENPGDSTKEKVTGEQTNQHEKVLQKNIA